MRKSELVAGTVYAYTQGALVAYPARLLDLRLWRKSARHSSSDPAAWRDVTSEPGARPGRSSSYLHSAMTGYLVLKGNSWECGVTAEQLAAIAVPELPEDSEKARKVIAGLKLPEALEVDILTTKHLLKPWGEYAREKAAQDVKAAEAKSARQKMKAESADAWAAVSGRLDALGIQVSRLRLDRDWEVREPEAGISLPQLTKLLDLAEKASRSQ